MIAAHSFVPDNTEVPSNMFASGVPVRTIGPADGTYPELGTRVAYAFNRKLGRCYATGLHLLER